MNARPPRPASFDTIRAFTVAELLIVLTVIAILAVLVVPTIQRGLLQSQMAHTLSSLRGLQIASQMMSTDNLKAGDGVIWTTVDDQTSHPRPATAVEYFADLVDKNYLSMGELQRYLTAPGIGSRTNPPTASNSCFKFFWVRESSPSDQPMFVTANWAPSGLDANAAPFGARGFVAFNKGGGGTMSRRAIDATNTNTFPSDPKAGYSVVILK